MRKRFMDENGARLRPDTSGPLMIPHEKHQPRLAAAAARERADRPCACLCPTATPPTRPPCAAGPHWTRQALPSPPCPWLGHIRTGLRLPLTPFAAAPLLSQGGRVEGGGVDGCAADCGPQRGRRRGTSPHRSLSLAAGILRLPSSCPPAPASLHSVCLPPPPISARLPAPLVRKAPRGPPPRHLPPPPLAGLFQTAGALTQGASKALIERCEGTESPVAHKHEAGILILGAANRITKFHKRDVNKDTCCTGSLYAHLI